MDTRNKRASVLGFALAALVVLPAPDSALLQGDRQQVSFSYSGVLAVTANPLELCDTTVVSLNPIYTVVPLGPEYDVVSLNPVRTVVDLCS